jgi:hypothetical protein
MNVANNAAEATPKTDGEFTAAAHQLRNALAAIGYGR